MDFKHLEDTKFLYELDNLKLRSQYVKIQLLSFDEYPIEEIQGQITGGSISINANSRVRRTLSLTMIADEDKNDLSNIDNKVSINKKIKVYIGIKNPLTQYKDYGDIVWFKGGTYVISTASLSRNAQGCTISITAKDKMVLLDGSVGGTLPASTTFHQSYLYNKDTGGYDVYYPPIYQIIEETVNHFGGQNLDDIIISDLDKETKLKVKYINDKPIYFTDDFSSYQFLPKEGYANNMYSYNEDIGYVMTDFTYPGELIHNAGSTVTAVLDDICKVLTNYEYFFDLDGKFIFQEIKNYLNTSYTPLLELTEEGYPKILFSDTKYKYSIMNGESSVSYAVNPKYDAIKNDFIVWGQRETAAGLEVGIRFHLAIDEKPIIDCAKETMWAIFKDLPSEDISLEEARKNYMLVRYVFSSTKPENGILIGGPCDEWREELYRQALLKQAHGVSEVSYSRDGYVDETGKIIKANIASYDEELIAEWRKLFDPTNTDWKNQWESYHGGALGTWEGWNPDVRINPGVLDYWLDFIDTIDLAQYSVNKIGRRTKVVNDTKIKTIYNMEVPDVVFFENPEKTDELYETIEKFNLMGQKFCILSEKDMQYFTTSSTTQSCFDRVRNLLYQAVSYNTNITISCFPKYYLEPNNLIYVKDEKSGINGNFVITQFTLPLTYNGTMSITATEALTQT